MDRALQRGDVVLGADFVRQLQHAHEHGRNQLRLRDLVGRDQLQELLGVEGFHDDGSAAEHDRHHVEAQRRRMVERRRRQIDAVGVHAAHGGAENFQKRVRHVDRIAFERALDALRPAGGAGRIEHVVAGDFVRDRRHRLRDRFLVEGAEAGFRRVHHVEQRSAGLADQSFHLLVAFRRGDEDFRAAIPHDVGDLVLGEIAADRGVIEPRALRGPADLHEREAVLHQQRDVIACFEAELAKEMRALVRELIELAIADRFARAGHSVGDLVGVGAGVD